VEVSDSGPGIAATDLSRIFGRFFTTRPGGHGTGLGLPLARALVEAHGGTLTATSPPGAGATFLMQLPMAPAAGSHPSDPARTQDDGCQDDGCQDDGCQDDG
jgi:signal transduction histidine kinase